MTEGDRKFDRFARGYDRAVHEQVSRFGFSPAYFDEYKVRHMAEFLGAGGRAGATLTVLNFGCGVGRSEPYLKRYFPQSFVYSVDVSEESIAVARERNRDLPGVFFSSFDGLTVPFDTEFDVIMVANVLHHIPFPGHREVVQSLFGRLRQGGHLFIFEHNPLNPLTRRIVRSCEFDRDTVLLGARYTRRIVTQSGFTECGLSYLVFFPPALSLILPLEKHLGAVPFGAQYCLAAKKT